jgi:hypothetical protein
MKKVLFALTVIFFTTACKKGGEPDVFKAATTYYLQAEAVDNDNITTTASPIVTVKVNQ